jgi:Kef-type K+ transport system membrane component KefB
VTQRTKRANRTICLLLVAILLPAVAMASGVSETFTRTSLLLILMITLADICGFIFERMGMAEILGQIYAGILLGNLALVGVDFDLSNLLRSSEFMVYSSELALILLLFIVGLESDMRALLKVGSNALAVAMTGMLLPVALALAAGAVLGFGTGIQGWFVGAMLAATSVGITAKVLGDGGLINTSSARVILGAAVIDDVLGILLLAVLASVVVTGEFSAVDLVWIVTKALLFFACAILIGQKLMPSVVHIISLNKHSSVWTGFALCLALAFAQLAHFAGLAPLIGAFVAGLILDDVDFRVGDALQKHRLEELVKPISDIMLTIFFVGIGAQVQLQTLLDPQVLLLIGSLTLVAIFSKGVAGYMVRGPGFDRLGIGFGMIPRGEVGLVFAAFAFGHQVFDAKMYSALVLVVLLTTLFGPILLKPRLQHF